MDIWVTEWNDIFKNAKTETKLNSLLRLIRSLIMKIYFIKYY